MQVALDLYRKAESYVPDNVKLKERWILFVVHVFLVKLSRKFWLILFSFVHSLILLGLIIQDHRDRVGCKAQQGLRAFSQEAQKSQVKEEVQGHFCIGFEYRSC